MQLKADAEIKSYTGGGGNALLRQVGAPDRPCSALITDFAPIERMGRLINPIDRKAKVSALAPDGTLLVLSSDTGWDSTWMVLLAVPVTSPPVEIRTLKIVEPPTKMAPDGSTVIYWSLTVRG